MDSELRPAASAAEPGKPPTTPPALFGSPKASGAASALAWMDRALQRDRQATLEGLEQRHRELLRKFEEQLEEQLAKTAAVASPGGSSPPGADVSHRPGTSCSIVSISSLPGVVDETDAAPAQTLPLVNMKKVCVKEPEAEKTEVTPLSPMSPQVSEKSSGVHKTPSRKSQSRALGEMTGESREIRAGSGLFYVVEVLTTHPAFEVFFSCLIMGNTLVMAFEAQYEGMATGHTINYHGYSSSASNSWPGASEAFEVMEWGFGVLFTIELLLKMIGLRSYFVYDAWNGIDTVIVVSWIFTAAEAVELPLDPMMLRLARLARLLRLVRLVRTIRGFDKLYLMTTAMKGSLSVLLWSVCLLGVVQAMLSLFLQAMLQPYIIEDNPENEAGRMQVYKFYGTFARTMLTMFEITLGNWMPPCRALVENVNEWYMIFSLGHKLFIGFSVVAVLNGVFIQETFKVASLDDKVMVLQKERAARAHTTKMHELFKHADESGDGQLDREEFCTALDNPEIKKWLSAMELDVSDAASIFDLVDIDGDGTLSAAELVKGAGRLKGGARSIDLVSMMRDHKLLQGEVQEVSWSVAEMKEAMLQFGQHGQIGRGAYRPMSAGYS